MQVCLPGTANANHPPNPPPLMQSKQRSLKFNSGFGPCTALRLNCGRPAVLAIMILCAGGSLGWSRAIAATDSASSAVESKTISGARRAPEDTIAKGTPAEAVKKLMGAPEEIKPFKSPSGKAEVWVYTREIDHRTIQVQVGSKPITTVERGADGQLHDRVIAEEPLFKMQDVTTQDRVELLMFNDHFLAKKVTRQMRRAFE